MTTGIAVIVLGLALATGSEAKQCRLAGVWKSDAARTLADIAGRSEPGALNVLSDDFFGHMIHAWTCTEMRAWFDDEEPGKPIAYRIIERDTNSVLVSFPDGSENNLRLIFEGECYKISIDEQRYEYFCRVEGSNGA